MKLRFDQQLSNTPLSVKDGQRYIAYDPINERIYLTMVSIFL